MRVACALTLAALLGAATAHAQAPLTLPPPAPECASVVIVKCDKPPAASAGPAQQDAARRIESRRTAQATQELDRVIVEGDSEKRTPEDVINRALARPLVRQGETTFVVSEGAQCTCRNICPPWPLPCCACTPQPGSRHATSPGWKPTD